jgi:hypothetical protein
MAWIRLLALATMMAGCGGSFRGETGSTKDSGSEIVDSDGDGYAADEDCDDSDDQVHPDADEVCDGVDNDCDEAIDDADPDWVTETGSTYHPDDDADEFGDPGTAIQACERPIGAVLDDTDCDDGNAAVNPDADEVCDGLDNDCDELVDDQDSDWVVSSGTTYYADDDADGYGDGTSPIDACDQPIGAVEDTTDCDDTNPVRNPGEAEVCDSYDNDCDGLVDADDPDNDDTSSATYYFDYDEDGFGDPARTIEECSPPSGYVVFDTDCDDTNDAINLRRQHRRRRQRPRHLHRVHVLRRRRRRRIRRRRRHHARLRRTLGPRRGGRRLRRHQRHHQPRRHRGVRQRRQRLRRPGGRC